MALFVQIDHFRKTDQKPTVKNHLFSISWFRSFNRTSFQQQLKHISVQLFFNRGLLQSYILSTTTETAIRHKRHTDISGFNRTSFQQQLKPYPSQRLASTLIGFNRTSFQQQLKHHSDNWYDSFRVGFNRTSFQQQLKHF